MVLEPELELARLWSGGSVPSPRDGGHAPVSSTPLVLFRPALTGGGGGDVTQVSPAAPLSFPRVRVWGFANSIRIDFCLFFRFAPK